MKYLTDDGDSGMRFPPSVCVADISLTGCEVRQQVRPSHVQPYPIGPEGTSGMSSDSLKSP